MTQKEKNKNWLWQDVTAQLLTYEIMIRFPPHMLFEILPLQGCLHLLYILHSVYKCITRREHPAFLPPQVMQVKKNVPQDPNRVFPIDHNLPSHGGFTSACIKKKKMDSRNHRKYMTKVNVACRTSSRRELFGLNLIIPSLLEGHKVKLENIVTTTWATILKVE